jgi:hypothetical protein
MIKEDFLTDKTNEAGLRRRIKALEEALKSSNERSREHFKAIYEHQKVLAKQLEKINVAYEFRADGVIKLIL